jgi:hypothetical protein
MMTITVKKEYGRLVPQLLRDMFQELQPFRRDWPARLMEDTEPFFSKENNEIWARMDANQPALWLTGQLYNDTGITGIMPSDTCDDLDLPHGSTYAMGARAARKELDSPRIRAPCVGREL